MQWPFGSSTVTGSRHSKDFHPPESAEKLKLKFVAAVYLVGLLPDMVTIGEVHCVALPVKAGLLLLLKVPLKLPMTASDQG